MSTKAADGSPAPRLSAGGKGVVFSLGVCLAAGLAGRPWDWPSAHGSVPEDFQAPTGNSKSAGMASSILVFLAHCAKCHDPDGRGESVRREMQRIPDFTSANWQNQRNDQQLKISILEGRGTQMPAFQGKLSEPQASDLVAFVRAFAPTRGKSEQGGQVAPDLASFNERFLILQKEWDELRRQDRELSRVSPGGAPSKPSESGQHEVARPSASSAPGTPAFRELFRQRCVKCHGADGTGNKARDRLPEIPDFTNASWQARRTDAQLLASILDGKGEDMPPMRQKISEQQARGLVAFVRAFAPTPGKP